MGKQLKSKKQLNLYKKEQLILCILVLLFVASGFFLPKLKERLYPPQVSVEDSIVSQDEIVEEVIENLPTDDVKEEIPEEVPENEVIEDTAEDNNANATNMESSNSSSTSTTKKPIQESTVSPKEEPKTEKPVEKPVEKPKEEVEKEPEKIWVPPLYETIHHEAVYETIRVIICNYCSEEFASVGEFQVHKEEHGG